MRAFADQVGVACRDGDILRGLTAYDCAEGRRLSAAELAASFTLIDDQFAAVVDPLREELGPSAPLAGAIETFVARAGLTAAEGRRARQALRALGEAESADLTERQSLAWMWNELEYDGSYFGDLPVGGYRELVEAMADGVDVRLRVEVAEVEVTAGGVRVHRADGVVEAASHVVVTVPLGVLKRGSPRFTPDLPPDRTAAIHRLGFGRYEKVVLAFAEPFWRDFGLSHLQIYPRDPDRGAVWIVDQDAFDGGPTLLCQIFHSVATDVLDVSPARTVQWILDLLSDVLGRPCPAPVDVQATSWGSDPFACGAYTHIPPGASPADVDLLGEPLGGRLLFAGEHTQSARMAYADGAMTSGLREAKRLLDQPSVRLGRYSSASSARTTPAR